MPEPRDEIIGWRETPRAALDPKSSRAYILFLEEENFKFARVLRNLRDYADTFDPKHDGKLPLAGVYAILDEAE